MNILKKIIRGISIAELIACALTFAVMVISYFIAVVNRNFIKGSMPWTEELALYSMLYMALLGMELGLRDGTQVSVTAVTSKLEGTKAGKVLDIIARVILLIFLFMMFTNGISLVSKQMQTMQTSPVLKVPMYALYLSLVISFGLAVLTQAMILIGKLTGIPMDEIVRVDDIIDKMFPKKVKEDRS